jgi:plastocyanin
VKLASHILLGGLLLTDLCGTPAVAVVVTIAVHTPSGTAAEDTLVVFDPLDSTPAVDKKSVTIDQVNKRFVPRVTILRTGTAVSFPNSDSIRHQVYSFSAAKEFSIKLYAGSPKEEIVFDKPGLVVLGCNIHDTMVGFVAVVDSPYFGKVSASGDAAVDLPPGRYRYRIWHPKMVSPLTAKEITVSSAAQAISLVLDIDANRQLVAPWP